MSTTAERNGSTTRFKSHQKATNDLATVYGPLRPTEVVDNREVGTVTAEHGTNEGHCVDNQTKRLSGIYTYINSRARAN